MDAKMFWVSICLAPPNQVQNMILFSMKFTLFIILPKKFPLKNSASQVSLSRCVLKHTCGCWMVFEKRGPYLSLQSARPPKIMCLMHARTNRAMRHFHSFECRFDWHVHEHVCIFSQDFHILFNRNESMSKICGPTQYVPLVLLMMYRHFCQVYLSYAVHNVLGTLEILMTMRHVNLLFTDLLTYSNC